jgi:hypothetical protein
VSAGGVRATARAIAVGNATLDASDNPTCTDCGPPSQLWEVAIRVVG